MDQIQALTDQIIAWEWEMMTAAHNIGGKASCQEDHETFALMRRSQMSPWPQVLLASYLEDLRAARAAGRNLLSEKYGYMMARTAPEEFAAIRRLLPVPSAEQQYLAETLCAQMTLWQEALAAQFPHLAGLGRPIRRCHDRPGVTSFETYLYAELLTYRTETLRHYAAFLETARRNGRNINREILTHTVLGRGYASLEAAENALVRRAQQP